MKYWETLFIKQRERGKDALTLPFLIGSQLYLPRDYPHQSIDDFIKDVASNNNLEICLRYCLGTATFVFEIRKNQNSCYYPTFNNEKQKGLSIASFHKNDFGESIEIVIENLKEKFQDKIDKEQFSADPNGGREPKWQNFSEEDIAFITRSFKGLDNFR